jgi:hypothetical protein
VRLRRAALAAVLAVSVTAAAACGSDDEISTSKPRTTPDLTVPTRTQAPDADGASTATTTTPSTTATEPPAGGGGGTGGATGSAPSSGGTPSAAAPQQAPSSSATGGATPAQPQQQSQGTRTTPSQTGGAQAGEFDDFCRENPGAC